jgi:hypothetical protein
MSDWVTEELQTARLGDKRLETRYRLLLQLLGDKPSLSIPAACKGWAETLAAYRFFDNPKVCEEKLLEPHRDATIRRVGQCSHVLLIQDTTEVDYTGKDATDGLGHLSWDERIGLLQHLTLAVTPERLSLGVTMAKIWGRKEHAKPRKKQPIELKESYRWVEGYRDACEIARQVPETQIVSVSDREGDIYEMLVEGQAHSGQCGAQWIIRSSQDRSLTQKVLGTACTYEKLRQRTEMFEVLGEIKITLRQRHDQAARRVRLAVRSGQVLLKAPFRKGIRLPETQVNVVRVTEIAPSRGNAPLDWILLTSLPVKTLAEAVTVVEYYGCRWQIEIFFRILKSGCKIEQLQLQSDERLKPCIALYLIIAWRTLFVTMLGRSCPDLPCTVIFEPEEWKSVWTLTQKQPLPCDTPSLAQCVAMIASLGGYLGRKSDGPPGPATIWIGLQRTKDFAMAWLAFGPEARTYV